MEIEEILRRKMQMKLIDKWMNSKTKTKSGGRRWSHKDPVRFHPHATAGCGECQPKRGSHLEGSTVPEAHAHQESSRNEEEEESESLRVGSDRRMQHAPATLCYRGSIKHSAMLRVELLLGRIGGRDSREEETIGNYAIK
jgi:hypothetical protein